VCKEVDIWCVQYGGSAGDVSLPRGEPRSGLTHHSLHAAGRRHGQHGRHGTLRGGRRHLHRSDERSQPLHWPGHHRQVSQYIPTFARPPAAFLPWTSSVPFCSSAVLDPRVGHTKNVVSPFISVLCQCQCQCVNVNQLFLVWLK